MFRVLILLDAYLYERLFAYKGSALVALVIILVAIFFAIRYLLFYLNAIKNDKERGKKLDERSNDLTRWENGLRARENEFLTRKREVEAGEQKLEAEISEMGKLKPAGIVAGATTWANATLWNIERDKVGDLEHELLVGRGYLTELPTIGSEEAKKAFDNVETIMKKLEALAAAPPAPEPAAAAAPAEDPAAEAKAKKEEKIKESIEYLSNL